ncbi:hypothetical protein BHYA_0175g00280 [Botrytis hyacinthi]|uniref:Uncharacterized protein n=1 Tax=Botrytis hyacinthi TaxID=278943 RepID=A0A4Z1GDD8_9HELO|nr:hypothetical protein BHYA_0175g00280 [Botrytis hyacinthi]
MPPTPKYERTILQEQLSHSSRNPEYQTNQTHNRQQTPIKHQKCATRCSTHPAQYHRNRIIPMSFACKPTPGSIVVRRPPVKIFCQRCHDKWRLGGFYEIEATTSITRVDRALAGTEFQLTREEIQEGLRKADELFRHEGF